MKLIRLWIGLVLVTFGLLGILDATGAIEASAWIGDWWPVAIIGLGVVGMIAERRVGLGPAIVVAIGVLVLADQQDWAEQDLFGPMILVLIGLVVLSGLWRRRHVEGDRPSDSLVMFGGSRIKERSEHFEHRDVSAIFGGAVLDLREAHLEPDASVDAMALFGGVDVLVPDDWRVAIEGTPIFGGFEDKTKDLDRPADAPTLRVHATAVFGGVGVKNAAIGDPDER